MSAIDAAVVGSGPNGMAAAVTLARAGLKVVVHERLGWIGGGAATQELHEPGFRHDLGSAVHPMAFASPFFREFGLAQRVDFVVPKISYGHPMDGGRAALAFHSLQKTAEQLGEDGPAWTRIFAPLLEHWQSIVDLSSSAPLSFPRAPLAAAQFGARIASQGTPAWDLGFRQDLAPALLTGVAAHTVGQLPRLASSAAGLVLALHAHAGGWPIPVGGSQSIIDALAGDLIAHGGEIITNSLISDAAELGSAKTVLFDTSPDNMSSIMGFRFPANYVRKLRTYQYGNGVAKVDFSLSEPVPWANALLRQTPTLHLGGSRHEIAAGEREVARGKHPRSPYVLVSQPSVLDPTRAPHGSQTLWTYTHVPRYSNVDPTAVTISQIERFAPGFRDVIRSSHAQTARQIERWNTNYIGGDIFNGAINLRQLLKRPTFSTQPWCTPVPGVYLCSSATPPGPGVHGLSGWHAARLALRNDFGLPAPDLQP